MFTFTNKKRWLQEAEAHVSKLTFKGLDLFWLNTWDDLQRLAPQEKKSHHQANHPLIGHDGTNSRILCQRAPKLQNTWFFAENTVVLAKGYRHTCSASPTKKVTWRGRGVGVKNKIQGAGPFFDWILADNVQRLAHRKKVASPGQSCTDRTWWDESQNFVSTRPNGKIGVFFLKIHLSLQKGTDTHVQLHQPKKWLEEAEAQVSKIKSKGLDLFLTEY